MTRKPVVGYFGHHKCASGWIVDILQQVTRDAGLRHLLVTDESAPSGQGLLTVELTRYGSNLNRTQIDRSMLRSHVEDVAPDFVSSRTADREQLDQLRPIRSFHVYRDPRDIVVSGYFSHRYSHDLAANPHIEAHRPP